MSPCVALPSSLNTFKINCGKNWIRGRIDFLPTFWCCNCSKPCVTDFRQEICGLFIRLNWWAFIKANGLDWKFQWCHLMNKNQQYRHLSLAPRPRQWYILSLRNSKYHKGCNNVLRAVVNPRHMMVLDAFKALCWQRERKIGCQY